MAPLPSLPKVIPPRTPEKVQQTSDDSKLKRPGKIDPNDPRRLFVNRLIGGSNPEEKGSAKAAAPKGNVASSDKDTKPAAPAGPGAARGKAAHQQFAPIPPGPRPGATAGPNPPPPPATTAHQGASSANVSPTSPTVAASANQVVPTVGTPSSESVPIALLEQKARRSLEKAVSKLKTQQKAEINGLRTEMDDRFTLTHRQIDHVADRAYAGIAAAMAMPNLTPSQPGKFIVAAGGATYQGRSAYAAGGTYRSRTGAWLVHGAIAMTSRGDAAVRAHVGYEF